MYKIYYSAIIIISFFTSCNPKEGPNPLIPEIPKGSNIALIGSNVCARMLHYDYFTAHLQSQLNTSNLRVLNFCDDGDTPGFRPHSGRNLPWAYPGAEKFFTEYANNSESQGTFPYPDEWLTKYKADIIFGFFGAPDSYEGIDSIPRFKAELLAFVDHTLAQKYNGKKAPTLILVAPIAKEDLSSKMDVPNGKNQNEVLKAYAKAMKEVAATKSVLFMDAFQASQSWYSDHEEDLTIDGFQLNDAGYKLFSNYLLSKAFGIDASTKAISSDLKMAIEDRNWFWENFYKIPNGVHVFGRRYNPFGQDNYPFELKKLEQMIAIRDTNIWFAAQGRKFELAKSDANTVQIPIIETNYRSENGAQPRYLYGEEALKSFTLPEGYKVELFASEENFPDLANPVQMSFDNKGRLWVAVMPSYPHYKPGDPRPNDKLLILEDTDNDGKADKQTVFADKLHLPIGFEFAPEGVYVSQSTHLKLLKDTNNDDKADVTEIILSGFDDHDTHHAISAFCADPSGALMMAEGVFLHTNVETTFGPIRATNGGFYRYNTMHHHLERASQIPIPNPWGFAFDEWGQDFFAETSGPDVRWHMPSSIKPVYGISGPTSRSLFEPAHRVRPTSGLEFVSSRHFPDEVQGDLLINNTIGFLGMKQHTMVDSLTGYASHHRHDLIVSIDPNFRPVDMEFAPDGSLYLIDWHNVLIGHMQHNARDPLRDHVHGRVYRITHTTRPLVNPAKVHGASITELLDNLKLPEYRTRYRSKRELRGKNTKEVLQSVQSWTSKLDTKDHRYEHHLLEAAWVTWGHNALDRKLLDKLLVSKDHRIRAAAIRMVRYNGHKLKDQADILAKAATDPHGRVRLEALVAASWLDKSKGLAIAESVGKQPVDEWIKDHQEAVVTNFKTRIKPDGPSVNLITDGVMGKGREIYLKEGHCGTCHQQDGKGLDASGFPSLYKSEWVVGDAERLIKLTLHGLMGSITVGGKKYDGKVPMTAFGKLLTDEEVAAVLTYTRKSFGNRADAITADQVKKVREKTKDKKGYYLASEL